jgi:DNA-binding transcriptional regulator YiaG
MLWMALPFWGPPCYFMPMSNDDFSSEALDALNQGDPKNLLEAIVKGLGAIGFPVPIAREAITASFALGRADAAGGPPPQQTIDFLEMMAAAPVAAGGFKTLREKLGFSQTDVGKVCGVGQSTVSEWESGVAPLPAKALQALMMLASGNMQIENPENLISGADLIKLRKALGMTQSELAAALGVHSVTVARWESASRDKPLAASVVRRIRPQLDDLRARAAAA